MLNATQLPTSIVGQHFVVAGAASGIGRAVAQLLARRGASVFCLDRNAEGNTDVVETLLEEECSVAGTTADVAKPGDVTAGFAHATEHFGQLHGLVNCVGVTGATGIRSHDVDPDDFLRVLNINLYGAFLLSKAAIPLMLPHHYGRVCHVASIAGKEGNAGMVSYSSSKAPLIGMVKSQGKEYALDGITVNAVAPAVIRTPLIDKMPTEQVEYMTVRIPMQRCGTLGEVAEMVAWVVSPAASFTTGFTFDLSGGRATY
jgi:2-dehydro-3-deoxy-L-rhamnonate dehydrogenase (NAD+)